MGRKKLDRSFRKLADALVIALCLLTLGSSLAFSAETTGKAKKEEKKKSQGTGFQVSKKDPIIITSNWMEADRKKNTVIYKGQVVAVQADITMKSDKLTAYYEPDMKQLKEVVAEGNVHVTQADRVATGTKGMLNGEAQTITLTGNPVVRQGNSEVSGTRIIFFIEEDRAVAEGGAQQRVKATIFPEEFEKREKGMVGPGKER